MYSSRRLVTAQMEAYLRIVLMLKALNLAHGQRRPGRVIHLPAMASSNIRSLSANLASRLVCCL
jgi:hypothetical protein